VLFETSAAGESVELTGNGFLVLNLGDPVQRPLGAGEPSRGLCLVLVPLWSSFQFLGALGPRWIQAHSISDYRGDPGHRSETPLWNPDRVQRQSEWRRCRGHRLVQRSRSIAGHANVHQIGWYQRTMQGAPDSRSMDPSHRRGVLRTSTNRHYFTIFIVWIGFDCLIVCFVSAANLANCFIRSSARTFRHDLHPMILYRSQSVTVLRTKFVWIVRPKLTLDARLRHSRVANLNFVPCGNTYRRLQWINIKRPSFETSFFQALYRHETEWMNSFWWT